MKSTRTWNAKKSSVTVVRYEKKTWMMCGTMWPPVSWIGLCAIRAAKLSDAPWWQRPQVFFLFAAATVDAGSDFATIPCVPPSALSAAWQFVQEGANLWPTRTSRPWIESWYVEAASGLSPAAFASSSLPWQASQRFAISRRSAGTTSRLPAVGSKAASFATAWGEPWQEAQVGPATFASSRCHLEWTDFANASVTSEWQPEQARNARGAVTFSFLSPSP